MIIRIYIFIPNFFFFCIVSEKSQSIKSVVSFPKAFSLLLSPLKSRMCCYTHRQAYDVITSKNSHVRCQVTSRESRSMLTKTV